MQLCDGSEVDDPRLGRVPEFDDRSRAYPIRMAIERRRLRSYTWRCDPRLDQGREGACVGFAWAHELAARPVEQSADAAKARHIYHEAQKVDEWPGGSYPGAKPRYEGTSVLAGAKIVQRLGYVPEYRWAFGMQDLSLAVGWVGPAVIGVNWYEGMFAPGPDGFIRVSGQRSGGHAVAVIGVNVRRLTFTIHNSWGPSWGRSGRAFISWADMDRLLREKGDACIPVKRASRRG